MKRESFDFDLLDEINSDENAPPKWNNKGKGRAVDHQQEQKKKKALVDGDSSDYGMDDDDNTFADSAFLETLDRVEKQAMGKGGQKSSSSTFPPKSTVNHSQASSISKTANPRSDVIEIDDESDGDKENDFVPMRHVRQRREEHSESELTRGRSPTTSQRWENSQTSNQKKGRAAVRSTNFNDVIDISDSD